MCEVGGKKHPEETSLKLNAPKRPQTGFFSLFLQKRAYSSYEELNFTLTLTQLENKQEKNTKRVKSLDSTSVFVFVFHFKKTIEIFKNVLFRPVNVSVWSPL